ncbi:MAG: bifunctional proline dehydrogenase/L-glutamate gamma-semialdehyde dehydrogenase, partial [Gammaproteobacteria bacterium]
MARAAEKLNPDFPDFVYDGPARAPQGLREAVNALFLADEDVVVTHLIEEARFAPDAGRRVSARARSLVEAVRRQASDQSGVEEFLHHYDLSSEEGVVLMCLAEALIRIPDADTADKLIRDKLSRGAWSERLGESRSLFVNASTWGLVLTGKLVRLDEDVTFNPGTFLARMVQRAGEPIVR